MVEPAAIRRGLGLVRPRAELGHDALAAPLHALVEDAHPKVVLLEPGSSEAVLRCDSRWRVRVNTSLEVEA